LTEAMTLDDELVAFYRKSGFGATVGTRSTTVAVYTGCMLVPMPDIETRRKFLKYHDLHHLLTGYSVGRIGEGEVSAWELGTGSARISPTLGVMNLIALSTGLVLEPSRMWKAFRRGCASRSLYPAAVRAAIDSARWADLAALRHDFLDAGPSARWRSMRRSRYPRSSPASSPTSRSVTASSRRSGRSGAPISTKGREPRSLGIYIV
jgi:hypothetical protein